MIEIAEADYDVDIKKIGSKLSFGTTSTGKNMGGS